MVERRDGEPDWLQAVINHNTSKLAEPGFEQRWVLVSCVAECANAGPWRVFVGAGEVFFCSACGKEMRHREE